MSDFERVNTFKGEPEFPANDLSCKKSLDIDVLRLFQDERNRPAANPAAKSTDKGQSSTLAAGEHLTFATADQAARPADKAHAYSDASRKSSNNTEQLIKLINEKPELITQFGSKLMKELQGVKELSLSNQGDKGVGFSMQRDSSYVKSIMERRQLHAQLVLDKNLSGNVKTDGETMKITDLQGIKVSSQLGARGRIAPTDTHIKGLDIGKEGKVQANLLVQNALIRGLKVNVNTKSDTVNDMQKGIADAIKENADVLTMPEAQKLLDAIKGMDKMTVRPKDGGMQIELKGKPADIPIDPESSGNLLLKMDRVHIPGQFKFDVKATDGKLSIENIDPPITIHAKALGGLKETTTELRGLTLTTKKGETPQLDINVTAPDPKDPARKSNQPQKIDLQGGK
jgi:hypothetical protein